jgi:hypothetical protein
MECEVMVAIQPAFLNTLKKILQERFVAHLPPILGNAPEAQKKEKQVARALTAFAIQTLFGADTTTSASLVVDDIEDHGVDGFYYDEQEKTLYFIQSKLKAHEQFKEGEAQAFLSGVKLLIDKQYGIFNKNIENLIPYLETALEQCDKVKLLIAYTGDGISISAQNEIRRVIQAERDEGDEQIQLDYVDFGPQKIEEALREEQAIGPVNAKIRVHKYRADNASRKTIFGLMKLQDLINLNNKHGRSLYEKNIRYFIGAGRRGVNSAIKATLANEPEHFLHLNNGITLVGIAIKQREKSRDNSTTRVFEVQGVSVVNGAQTISSAAQYIEQNPEADISTAQVMVTIIETGNDSFHKQVTKARNLQNPVDLSNFAALDDNQERLRKEIALYGIDYQYRPQRQLISAIPNLTIDNLVKALACYNQDIRYPARLKSEAKQFTDFESETYKSLFSLELTGHKALNIYTVFEVVNELTASAERGASSPEKLIYRHCGYALASILMKMLRSKIEAPDILQTDDVKVWLSVPFDEIRQEFSNQYNLFALGAAPHAFFKRVSDTSKLINKVWIEHQGLQEDRVVTALLGRLSRDDPHNQSLFNVLKNRAAQL